MTSDISAAVYAVKKYEVWKYVERKNDAKKD